MPDAFSIYLCDPQEVFVEHFTRISRVGERQDICLSIEEIFELVHIILAVHTQLGITRASSLSRLRHDIPDTCARKMR